MTSWISFANHVFWVWLRSLKSWFNAAQPIAGGDGEAHATPQLFVLAVILINGYRLPNTDGIWHNRQGRYNIGCLENWNRCFMRKIWSGRFLFKGDIGIYWYPSIAKGRNTIPINSQSKRRANQSSLLWDSPRHSGLKIAVLRKGRASLEIIQADAHRLHLVERRMKWQPTWFA